jgi:hypothetical protein
MKRGLSFLHQSPFFLTMNLILHDFHHHFSTLNLIFHDFHHHFYRIIMDYPHFFMVFQDFSMEEWYQSDPLGGNRGPMASSHFTRKLSAVQVDP